VREVCDLASLEGFHTV